TECRLRHMQPFAGAGEAQGLSDRGEGLELAWRHGMALGSGFEKPLHRRTGIHLPDKRIDTFFKLNKDAAAGQARWVRLPTISHDYQKGGGMAGFDKRVGSYQEALAGLSDGMSIIAGGFGLCGIPENLIAQI